MSFVDAGALPSAGAGASSRHVSKHSRKGKDQALDLADSTLHGADMPSNRSTNLLDRALRSKRDRRGKSDRGGKSDPILIERDTDIQVAFVALLVAIYSMGVMGVMGGVKKLIQEFATKWPCRSKNPLIKLFQALGTPGITITDVTDTIIKCVTALWPTIGQESADDRVHEVEEQNRCLQEQIDELKDRRVALQTQLKAQRQEFASTVHKSFTTEATELGNLSADKGKLISKLALARAKNEELEAENRTIKADLDARTSIIGQLNRALSAQIEKAERLTTLNIELSSGHGRTSHIAFDSSVIVEELSDGTEIVSRRKSGRKSRHSRMDSYEF